ncbi:MAG: HlyD family efflux transporter periplasmic adaptor subunit, partial [Planctomycetaceae bacterium]|nr:HlyD family efflux transporter periplasmic adaptor subunit [Planctomycetaceae bacterium]
EKAETAVRQAEADLELARLEMDRAEKLLAGGGGTKQQLETATNAFRTQTERVSSAKFGEQIAKYELEQAQAALTFSQSDDPSPETVRFDVVSPINGRVLRVLQESAAVVQPGTPLLELGDTTDLEVEVDVLSTDAVQIQPGARVSVEHWGGEKPLNGFVQLIEPSGFTRVSALGVEEQRVNVIIKFDEPLERRQGLGDAFRVEARIVIWEAEDIIKLPTSALFRDGDEWAVFVAREGKASLRHVEIGHRNSQEAEVVSGLKSGEVVIEHPADQIRSGVLIVPRGEERDSEST